MWIRSALIFGLLAVPGALYAQDSSGSLGPAVGSLDGASTSLNSVLQPGASQTLQSGAVDSAQSFQGASAQTLQGSTPLSANLAVIDASTDGSTKTLSNSSYPGIVAVTLTAILVAIAAYVATWRKPKEMLPEEPLPVETS